MELLFVYGNLMDANVQQYVFKRKVDFAYDVLFDYRKETIKEERCSFVTLIPARGFSINGSILYLSPEEVKQLDDKQGSKYKKLRVKLTSGKEAWAYVSP